MGEPHGVGGDEEAQENMEERRETREERASRIMFQAQRHNFVEYCKP